MKTKGIQKTPRTDDLLVRLLVETLTQQNRDLEAGAAMYRAKNGPPEEAERLRERARRMRVMFEKMTKQLESASTAR